ncbi:MAG: 2-C-methyl-D-erythritol 4-phosphate cytidylyltransferase [Sarcina sp.]
MKNVAIILAGGKGKRMGNELSKQFIVVKDKPIIYYTIEAFRNIKEIDEIIVVLPKDEIEYFKKLSEKFDIKVSKIVEGGKERQDSVYNALKIIENNCKIVLIHDGARPLVTEKIITDGIINAKNYLAAAPGVMPKDTIKVIDEEGFSKSTLVRNNLFAVQTPQCFDFQLIKSCHEKVKEEGLIVTDDTMVVEHYGNKVYLYEGNYENIKITTKEDLVLLESLLEC